MSGSVQSSQIILLLQRVCVSDSCLLMNCFLGTCSPSKEPMCAECSGCDVYYIVWQPWDLSSAVCWFVPKVLHLSILCSTPYHRRWNSTNYFPGYFSSTWPPASFSQQQTLTRAWTWEKESLRYVWLCDLALFLVGTIVCCCWMPPLLGPSSHHFCPLRVTNLWALVILFPPMIPPAQGLWWLSAFAYFWLGLLFDILTSPTSL